MHRTVEVMMVKFFFFLFKHLLEWHFTAAGLWKNWGSMLSSMFQRFKSTRLYLYMLYTIQIISKQQLCRKTAVSILESQLLKQFRFCCKVALKNNNVIFQFSINLVQFNNWSVDIANFYSAIKQLYRMKKCHLNTAKHASLEARKSDPLYT